MAVHIPGELDRRIIADGEDHHQGLCCSGGALRISGWWCLCCSRGWLSSMRGGGGGSGSRDRLWGVSRLRGSGLCDDGRGDCMLLPMGGLVLTTGEVTGLHRGSTGLLRGQGQCRSLSPSGTLGLRTSMMGARQD